MGGGKATCDSCLGTLGSLLVWGELLAPPVGVHILIRAPPACTQALSVRTWAVGPVRMTQRAAAHSRRPASDLGGAILGEHLESHRPGPGLQVGLQATAGRV